MGDNIYTQVKAAVTPKQAAERLGLEIINDKIKSPWNANDQNPSCHLYNNDICDFSSNKKRHDVVDLTATVKGISQHQAARWLAEEFRIPILKPPDKKKGERLPTWKWFLLSKKSWKGYKVKAIYPYVNIDTGVIAFLKIRWDTPPDVAKIITFGRIEQDRYRDGKPPGIKSIKDLKAIYTPNLDKLIQAAKNSETVYYCEGEKDVDTLTANGYAAFTCGSSGDWNPAISSFLSGAVLTVLQDNDEQGRHLTGQIKKDLQGIARSIRVIVPTPDIPHGDISDYFRDHTKEDFEKMLSEKQTETVQEPERAAVDGQEVDLLQFCKFSKEGNPIDVIDNRVSEYIVKHYNLFVLFGKAYIYDGGFFRYDEDGILTMDIVRQLIIPDLINDARLTRIYRLLLKDKRLQIKLDSLNDYPDTWVNFKNGMLDVMTGIMHDHDPKYKAVNQIPHDYIAGLDFDKSVFNEFLKSRIRNRKDLKMLLEYYGYTLLPRMIFPKFLMFIGMGNAGKSILLKVISAMHGEENVAAIPLQNLSDRFTSAFLLNRQVNICGDLDCSTPLQDLSVIKQSTGDDLIRAEIKGGQIFFFRNRARFIFSANEMPPVLNERSNGFFRRLMIIRFDNQGDFIPNLNAKLFSEEEIQTVICASVAAIKDALERGRLYESENSQAEVEKVQAESDSVAAYLQTAVTINPEKRERRKELFDDYEKFCRAEERTPLGKTGFFKALRTKGFPEIKVHGDFFIKGLSLEMPEFVPVSDGEPVFD